MLFGKPSTNKICSKTVPRRAAILPPGGVGGTQVDAAGLHGKARIPLLGTLDSDESGTQSIGFGSSCVITDVGIGL